MKKTIIALILIASSNIASAAFFTHTGAISILRTHDSNIGTDVDWVSVSGFTVAGSCRTSSGYVVVRIRDDAKGQRQYAMVLSAAMGGQMVTLRLNEDVKDSAGYCYLDYMDIQP